MPPRLPRLRGAVLKRSNEELLAKYGKLVRWLAGRNKRRFRLTDEAADDLEQSLLAILFQAPSAYRNPAGIHLIFRTRLQNVMRTILKREAESPMGLMHFGPGLKLIDKPPKLEPHLNGMGDLGHALKKLETLSSPERAVLGMSFGIDGYDEFGDYSIARRLGKTKSWVRWKRKRAIFKMQNAMGLKETEDGL